MSSATITTIVKMMESLPEDKQKLILHHIREYISEIEDNIKWDITFKNSGTGLSKIAKDVKRKTVEGKAEDFNYKKL